MIEGIHPWDWLLKPGSQLDPPESTVFEWVTKRTSWLEYHPKKRMGPVPVGVHALQCSHHVEKRASQALPRIAVRDGQVSPWMLLGVDPFRVPWFRDPKGGRTSLQGRACSSAWCTPLQTTRWVHEVAAPRTQEVHNQSWPTKWNWVT